MQDYEIEYEIQASGRIIISATSAEDAKEKYYLLDWNSVIDQNTYLDEQIYVEPDDDEIT